jgi:hypothetical protein
MSTSSRRFTILASAIAALALLALLVVLTRGPKVSSVSAVNLCSQTTDSTLLGSIDWQGTAPVVAQYGTRQGSGLTPTRNVGPWTLTATPNGIVGTFAVSGRILEVRSQANVFDGARHCTALTYSGNHLALHVASI